MFLKCPDEIARLCALQLLGVICLTWPDGSAGIESANRTGHVSTENSDVLSTYLRFSDEADGKCHNLSEGGQLSYVTNEHPRKRIKLRLYRMFGGVRQGGPLVIELATNEKAPLGCSLVDGHKQRWEIERAAFVE